MQKEGHTSYNNQEGKYESTIDESIVKVMLQWCKA